MHPNRDDGMDISVWDEKETWMVLMGKDARRRPEIVLHISPDWIYSTRLHLRAF